MSGSSRLVFDLPAALIALAVIGYLIWCWWADKPEEPDDTDVGG